MFIQDTNKFKTYVFSSIDEIDKKNFMFRSFGTYKQLNDIAINILLIVFILDILALMFLIYLSKPINIIINSNCVIISGFSFLFTLYKIIISHTYIVNPLDIILQRLSVYQCKIFYYIIFVLYNIINVGLIISIVTFAIITDTINSLIFTCIEIGFCIGILILYELILKTSGLKYNSIEQSNRSRIEELGTGSGIVDVVNGI
jgi:hypothetical protein